MADESTRDPFEDLAEIEREVDELQRAGTWSRVHFDRLWQRASSAAQSISDATPHGFPTAKQLLMFLASAAASGWRPELQYDAIRVPAVSAAVIRRVQSDGIPPVFLVSSTRCVWNGTPLRSVILDVVDRNGHVTLEGSCNEDDLKVMEASSEPGSIVRTTLQLEFAGGWVLSAEGALVVSAQFSGRRSPVQVVVVVAGWSAIRGDLARPLTWAARIDSRVPVRFGNLHIDRLPLFVTRGDQAVPIGDAGGGWGHLRVTANYPCALARTRKAEDRGPDEYALIVETETGQLDAQLLDHDLRAIEFVLGRRLRIGTLHAIEDGRVCALFGSWRRAAHADHGPGPAIGTDVMEYQRFLPELAQKVAVALPEERTPLLALALDAYLDSDESYVDRDTRVLLDGLQSISRLHLDRAAARPSNSADASPERTRAQTLRAALDCVGLDPRKELLVAESYAEALDEFGALSTVLDRPDPERRRQLDNARFLRSLLVALVARYVGYVGPILGDPITSAPPEWWPFDHESAPMPTPHFASTAPRAVRLPRADQPCVLVQDPDTAEAVRTMIRAAGIKPDSVAMLEVPAGTLRAAAGAVARLRAKAFVVVPSPTRHLPSVVQDFVGARELGPDVSVLPAVPTPFSWLLADDNALRSIAREDPERLRLIESLPAPDSISDGARVVHQLLGPRDEWMSLLPGRVNVLYAAGRSASLRNFLAAIGQSVGNANPQLAQQSVAHTLSREVLAGLLRQTMADDAVAWRTADGSTHTAAELSHAIEVGSALGLQYVTDVISVAMDLLARQSRRNG